MRFGATIGGADLKVTCAVVVLGALVQTACTPQTALVAAAVPSGTTSVLLSQTERVRDDNRRQIVAYEQARDWTGLARLADENLKRDPHTPDWRLIAGYAYTQLGQHAQAAAQYAEAVRLEPDMTLYWTLLAQSWRAAGQPERALAVLDNASLARRDDPQIPVLQGDIRLDQGRATAAIQAYRTALAIDERHVPAWRGLERAHRASGNSDEAVRAGREAQRITESVATKPAASR